MPLYNTWIEKTIVRGREDRLSGERALGKALWSPQRGNTGADIYKNMRSVQVGDVILHLIDNEKISGISTVKVAYIETTGLANTDWEGPAFLIELENYTELIPPINRTELLIEKNKVILEEIAELSEVFYTNLLSLRQGAYLTPCPVELLQLINETYIHLSGKELPYVDKIDFKEINTSNANDLTLNSVKYCISIKTKPFIILAGISGTGKSRLVRKLAYEFCNNDELKRDEKPGNFELVKVKPNWHDSTELLGYESRISGKDRYIVTDFLKFIIKAWQYTDTPFFLCLDEMNLAPVEQYFAEYLSVIETRDLKEGKIITDSIVNKSLFERYADKTTETDPDFDLWKELNINDEELKKKLLENGLTLPSNLIIMGTVNMDETTHSFSRKVLDRAMTIEMTVDDLYSGLTDHREYWDYPDTPFNKKLVISEKTDGWQVYNEFVSDANLIIKYLELLNEKLEGTPFKIAYRVRDEFLLYAYNVMQYENKSENWLKEVKDEMTLMKILPKIEGDEEKTEVLENLIEIFKTEGLENSLEKAIKMNKKRTSFHYTSFWD